MLPAVAVEEVVAKPAAGCCRQQQRRCHDESSSVVVQHRNEQDSNTISCNRNEAPQIDRKHKEQISRLADFKSNQITIDSSKRDKTLNSILANKIENNKKSTMQQISIISNIHHERLASCPDEGNKHGEETSEMIKLACRQQLEQAQDGLRDTARHPLLRPHLTRTKQLKDLGASCLNDLHNKRKLRLVESKHKTMESTKKSSPNSSSSHQVAISSLPSIIVCVSVALLVLVSRTSALNKPTQSLQQLAKSADVELSRRSLQRSQRDTVAPLVIGSNSTTAIVAGSGLPPTCGYPGSPAHASVTFNTSHVAAGTAASYTCDNGYELLGPPRRICQANGTWAPIGIPFCGK